MGLSDQDRELIVAWARRHPEIKAVHLYGSRARGDHRPDSDIDLAITLHRNRLDADPENTWIFWISDYNSAPDLHLSQKAHLQWYEKDAGLERVGPGVERDGILLYPV